MVFPALFKTVGIVWAANNDLVLKMKLLPNQIFMEKLTIKPSVLKMYTVVLFIFLETRILFAPISHDSSFLNSSFLLFETSSSENQKSFLHHFFPSSSQELHF